MKKQFKKQAFTLIELLIVIAIIGILFIVLVSKVDFATDKAKATGVQTDFRSFQLAFDTVSRENAGFNTFGWDTGDANQNGKRDSYDEGDTNKNGIQDGTEVFTGHKIYSETFTKVYSLKKNGTGSYDRDALNRLEAAINANLDPKLHITIKDDGEIVMANGAQDPWNKEYHGWYITNAEVDGKDRGAIVMYSDGANNTYGSAHEIANGVVTVSVPGNNKDGKDDYSIVSVYTYVNGYGKVQNITTGFGNNQVLSGNTNVDIPVVEPEVPVEPEIPDVPEVPVEPEIPDEPASIYGDAGLYNQENDNLILSWDAMINQGIISEDGVVATSSRSSLEGYLKLPNDMTKIPANAFYNCTKITGIELPENIEIISGWAFYNCTGIKEITIPKTIKTWQNSTFYKSGIKNVYFEGTLKEYCLINRGGESPMSSGANLYCDGILIEHVVIPEGITHLSDSLFAGCTSLKTVVVPGYVKTIAQSVFRECPNLTSVELEEGVEELANSVFYKSSNIKDLNLPTTIKSIGTFYYDRCNFKDPSNFVSIINGVVYIDHWIVDVTKSSTNLQIEYGTVGIASDAFAEIYNFDTITIPPTVEYVNNHAFDRCGVKHIVFEDNSNLKVLGGYVFFSNDYIETIDFGTNSLLESIGSQCFDGMDNLTELKNLSSQLKTIAYNAFGSAPKLNLITYNGTIAQWKKIQPSNFSQRSYLTNVVVCSDGEHQFKS